MIRTAGLFNLDGSPVPRASLEQLVATPGDPPGHAVAVWTDGPVGFARRVFSAAEADAEAGRSQNGMVRILADARIDAQDTLRADLKKAGRVLTGVVNDADLIAHAYHAWGEACVDHLLGDFTFAVWDPREGKLFCARDHFGVRPFYYARVKDCLVWSNDLALVLAHPGVNRGVDEQAVADLLLFGFNHSFDTTFYRGVQRLYPAHTLASSGGHYRLRRYWRPPTDGRVRYRRSGEYVEHFTDILRTATRERIRGSRVGLLLSGGMDSTSVAAMARECQRGAAHPFELHGFCDVYHDEVEDPEYAYSALAADHLQVPMHYRFLDTVRYCRRWDLEPRPVQPGAEAPYEGISPYDPHCDVMLTGMGGDLILHSEPAGVFERIRRLRISRLPGLLRRLSDRVWSGQWQQAVVNRAGPPPDDFPCWLNPGFVQRLGLRERWASWNELIDEPWIVHPVHAEGYRQIRSMDWPGHFEAFAAMPNEPLHGYAHPFHDVRLVTYLLALPARGWLRHKRLLRRAMRPYLPQSVRTRPKAPAVHCTETDELSGLFSAWGEQLLDTPRAQEYIATERLFPLLQTAGDLSCIQRSAIIGGLSLAHWLRYL